MFRRVQRALNCASIVLAITGAASAQCFDWTSDFHRGGPSGPVHAQATFDDGSGSKLYVAGAFVSAGATAANCIAAWDGTSWSALGSGITGDVYTRVLALEVLDLGNGPALYAAGHFSNAGGTSVNNIAVWDGASWSALGAGLQYVSQPSNGYVQALEAFDAGSGPELYAGGLFDTAGSNYAVCIAKWGGTAWSNTGGFGTNSIVRALEVYDDGSGSRLFAGGGFTFINGLPRPFLASWDGVSWSAVPGAPGGCFALAVHDDGNGSAIFASCQNTLNGSSVVRWNGANLTTLPFVHLPVAMTAYDDGVTGAQLYVAGPPSSASPWISRWNGASWTPIASPQIVTGSIHSLEIYDDGVTNLLFAGGDFDFDNGNAARCLASWDGANWSRVGAPTGVDAEVFALGTFDSGAGDELAVGGSFKFAAQETSAGVARWNGADWSALAGSLSAGSAVRDFAAFDGGSGSALYCGGNFTTVAGVSGFNKIARWDANAWSQLAGGVTTAGAHSVRALVVHNDGGGRALYVGGQFKSYDGAPGDHVARWNGSAWSPLGAGTDAFVRALAVFDEGSGARLFAGGQFHSAGGSSALRIARWDGLAWSAVGGGLGGNVQALAVFDDGTGPALYVGGSFDTAGGVPVSNIARWDGTNWLALGAGCDASVAALAVFDDGRGPALYAAGSFTHAGGLAANHLARWNGVVWEALGDGLDREVHALHVHDDGTGAALFVGGNFMLAGGRVSNYLAKWGRVCCAPHSYCTAGTTSSGCVPTISGLGVPSASASSAFTIRIDAVEGQKQGHIFYGLTGALANPWSPSSASFLCVKAPSQRTGTQNSGGTSGACDGVIQLDWNAYVAANPTALGVPFSAGTQVWAQLYFRDPPAPKSTNLSDGLSFSLCP